MRQGFLREAEKLPPVLPHAFRRALPIAIPAAIAGIFVAFAVAKGVPAMRHDWWMPADSDALKSATLSALSTWRNDGLGNPTLYPNDYLFYAFVLALSAALPPAAVLAAIAAAVGALAVVAARTFASSVAGASGIAAILLFNPWTYDELVAGHLPMLLSFAATAWFAAECAKGRRASPLHLCIATVVVAQQLQFLAILVPAAALLWIARGIWQPLAVAAIVALPVAIGVALGYGDLQAIPYTLDWERNQSLHAPALLTLRGYFAQYDAALGRLGAAGGTALALAALAAVAIVRTRAAIAIAIALLALFAFTLGTNGPVAPLYAFVVTHVKASALFRELYDLIAYAAIGYVALIAAAIARAGRFAAAAALAGSLMLASWAFSPPSQFWVASGAIPISPIAVPQNTRFALLPPFQPLQFRGAGSGVDPDVFNRPGNVAPLNAYLPSYPAVTALARYASGGGDAMLRGLSVGEIVSRPWLCTDVPSLRAQVVTRDPIAACASAAVPKHLNAASELALQPRYAIGTLLANAGAGNLLALDAARAGLIGPQALATVVPAPTTPGTDPAHGWADARLFFATHPDLGQPYGGVYTTSPQPLAIVAGDRLLAQVRGRLLDARSGAPLRGVNAREFRWLSPGNAAAVRCDGECAIAAEAPSTFGYAADPPANPQAAVAFRMRAPWLVIADVPAAAAGSLLRYDVHYTPYWRVFGEPAALRHVRVDGAVNGWVVEAAAPPARVAIVEVRSCAAAIAELAAVLALAGLFGFAFRTKAAAA